MTPTDLSQPARLKAWISSSQVRPRKAFITFGRLMAMVATPSATSNRMSSYCMVFPPWSAGHGQAAGHAEHLSGDEGGVVAREEEDRAGQVVGLGDAAHRD